MIFWGQSGEFMLHFEVRVWSGTGELCGSFCVFSSTFSFLKIAKIFLIHLLVLKLFV